MTYTGLISCHIVFFMFLETRSFIKLGIEDTLKKLGAFKSTKIEENEC